MRSGLRTHQRANLPFADGAIASVMWLISCVSTMTARHRLDFRRDRLWWHKFSDSDLPTALMWSLYNGHSPPQISSCLPVCSALALSNMTILYLAMKSSNCSFDKIFDKYIIELVVLQAGSLIVLSDQNGFRSDRRFYGGEARWTSALWVGAGGHVSTPEPEVEMSRQRPFPQEVVLMEYGARRGRIDFTTASFGY